AGYKPGEKLSSTKVYRQEKTMISFDHVVGRSIEEWAPHYITTYLLSLCREFNSWYASKKIIDESNQDIENDLLIAEKTTFILKNGLYLLGIKSPEVM
ncbi:hypothetical protein KC842_02000, partial [Candidatus Nomurabacteria bacterium]|nr:hypothetical protein [Candidatus Nomurabacteria bacterium]